VIEVAVDAYGAEYGVGFACGAVHVKASGDQAVDYVLDLGVCGAFLHYDYHDFAWFPSFPPGGRKVRAR
jgi:hypothetical protein